MTDTVLRGPGRRAFGLFGTIGIIGLGSFGRFVFDYFNDPMRSLFTRLYGFDPDKGKGSNGSLIEAATCDIVILAVPAPVFESVLKQVVAVMKPGAVLIDVSTVKLYTVELLQKYATPAGRNWIATHPLFGPQSYKANNKSLKGLQLVVCERSCEREMLKMARELLIGNCGLDVRIMSADKHDRTIGVDQFVTQYFGRCVEAVTDGEKRRVQTLSTRLFHEAMSLMGKDDALFWWVYKYNPYCRDFVEKIEARMLAMRERRMSDDHA